MPSASFTAELPLDTIAVGEGRREALDGRTIDFARKWSKRRRNRYYLATTCGHREACGPLRSPAEARAVRKPEWWDWDLRFTSHLEIQMRRRHLSALDLVGMFGRATGYRRGEIPERWIIQTRHRRRPWEIVVEPDVEDRELIIITTYPRHDS